MAKTLHVDIVSAEEAIFSGEAEMVVAPGEAGELGILPEHTPLLTRIKPGTVRIIPGSEGAEEVIYVSGGMMEVQPDRVTVLADTSVRAHDLDEAKAMEAERLAKEAISSRTGAMEIAKAQAELAEAVAQLAAIRKLRQKK
jgi:F-type H+-transporting ATPase subunit epsilon